MKSGFVDGLCVYDLGVADLQSLLGVDLVEALLRKVELPGAFVLIGVVKILITCGERIGGGQLVIETRAEVVPGAGVGYNLGELGNDLKCDGIYKRGVHDMQVNDIATFDVERERGAFAQRSADISTVLCRMIAGRRCPKGQISKRVSGVKCRRGSRKESLAVKLLRAGLGENFDSSVSELVVLRRKRILINADFANGSLGREGPGGKAVYIDLTAIRTCGRTGKRLKFGLQLIGIVRKSFEILALHHHHSGVVRRSNVNFRR